MKNNWDLTIFIKCIYLINPGYIITHMKGEIVEGDFPKGATLAPAGLIVQDAEISWVDGWTSKTERLRDKIEKIELLDRGSLPAEFSGNSLTPLEGGIIGGSVAGYDGFLAGYLSLPVNQEAALFSCYLTDGRYFVCISDTEMYNLLLSI
jgi:hypothetical protein